MARLTIIFAMATIAMSFIISFVAQSERVGVEVSERFLERSSKMPPGRAEDDSPAKMLKRWAQDKTTGVYAQAYAWKIIPMDLLYLIAGRVPGVGLGIARLTHRRA